MFEFPLYYLHQRPSIPTWTWSETEGLDKSKGSHFLFEIFPVVRIFVCLLLSLTTFIHQSQFKHQDHTGMIWFSSIWQTNIRIQLTPLGILFPHISIPSPFNSTLHDMVLKYSCHPEHSLPVSNLSVSLLGLDTQIWTQYLRCDVIRSTRRKMILFYGNNQSMQSMIAHVFLSQT